MSSILKCSITPTKHLFYKNNQKNQQNKQNKQKKQKQKP